MDNVLLLTYKQAVKSFSTTATCHFSLHQHEEVLIFLHDSLLTVSVIRK